MVKQVSRRNVSPRVATMITNVFDVLGTMAFEHNFGGIIMGEVVFENGNGKVNGGGDSPDEHG